MTVARGILTSAFKGWQEVRAALGTSLVMDSEEARFSGKEAVAILSLVHFIALFHLYLHKPNKRSSERNIKREQRDKGLETNEKI